MRCQVINGRSVDTFGVAAVPPDALQSLSVIGADGGETFSIAVASNGSVLGWGCASRGELGGDDEDDRLVRHPSLVRMQLKTPCIAVACGRNHVLAISNTGCIFAWGCNSSGQLGIDQPPQLKVPQQPTAVVQSPSVTFTSIAAGGMHSLALDSAGIVWSWGDNSYGQLGLGVDDKTRNSPAVTALTTKTRARSIAAGWAHSALVADDGVGGGAVYTFGWGLYHQLGHGSTSSVSTPTCVDALTGLLDVGCDATQRRGIVHVQCGNWHTAALTASGDVYAWGWGEAGQLGPTARKSEPMPRVVDTSDGYFSSDASGHEAIDVACGARYTAVLCRNGDLHWWGHHSDNVVGANGLIPCRGDGSEPASHLAAGHSHLLLLSPEPSPA